MQLKLKNTEKSVKLMDMENTVVFETGRNERKEDIKERLEKMFNIKIESLRTSVRKNKKVIYARLSKKYVASDIATKIGTI